MKALITVFVLFLLVSLASADRPTTSADGANDSDRSGRSWHRRHAAGAPGREPSTRESPTDEEWKEAMTYMQEHSPRRYELLRNMPTDGPRQTQMRRFIYGQYRWMQALKRDEPEMYALRVQAMEAEDAAVGSLADLRNARNPEDKRRLRNELRQKVAKLVNLWLQERERRIQRLEKILQREKDSLATDKANPDQLIERRLNRILREGPRVREKHSKDGR